MISHEDSDVVPAEPQSAWKIIRPRPIDFISYPYEWSFSQLKDAALTTLKIQKIAMDHGMSLKDASAFNIQFQAGRPIFIDTLSFERYEEGQPWSAYRQACQHFLAPLALMALRDVRLNQLLRTQLDGIPLDLASSLLPRSSKFNFSLLIHLHLHAKMQKRHASTTKQVVIPKMSRMKLLGLIDSLESTINRLSYKPSGTEWADYTQNNSYSSESTNHKRRLVTEYIQAVAPKSVWDLGANTGQFSRLASDNKIPTVAFDIDPAAVELNYLQIRQRKETHLLPLLMDLTNPTPSLGWDNDERYSLAQRGPVDLVLSLALIHHLAISANVPLDHLGRFFRRLTNNLILEFVPKSDPQVAKLLVVRKDIFGEYTQDNFEASFARYFHLSRREPIVQSQRTLYLFTSKGSTC